MHLGGWRKQRQDARDAFYSLRFPRSFHWGRVPPAVDLAYKCSAIEDQGELGSCTACALAGAVEANANKPSRRIEVSRLFGYYATRWLMELDQTTERRQCVEADTGATLRDTIKAAARFGMVDEALWPYSKPFCDVPPRELWFVAAEHRVTSYHSIADGDLETVKAVLAQGFLVLVGLQAFADILSAEVARTGDVPMPRGHYIGGHAVALVGYDDAPEHRRFRFRNSWGAGWGAEGYGTLSYDYVANPSWAADFWCVRSGYGKPEEESERAVHPGGR